MSLYQAFLEALVRGEIMRERVVPIEIDDVEKAELVIIINYLLMEWDHSMDEFKLLINAYRSGGSKLFDSTLYDLAEDNVDIKEKLTRNRRNKLFT